MPSTPSIQDRLVRLVHADPVLMVRPPAGAPFPVPQFPVSQIVWLDHLSELLLKRSGRCLAVALMLDLSREAWVRPELPTQRCGAEGARWSWQAGDFEGRNPSVVIAGSYQSAVLRDLSEAVSLVPPTDGVHLVGVIDPKPGVHAFVHVEGQTHAIEARTLVFDDTVAALDACSDRLALE